jgi:hypothetical protein
MIMIKIPTEIELKPIEYLSPSGINCFARCPAKYFYDKVLRLEKVDRSHIALDYGKCVHCAIPEAYESAEQAAEVFNKVWAEEEYGDSDEKRNSTRARASFEAFFDSHQPGVCPYEVLPPPTGTVITKDKFTDWDSPFLVDIGGDLLMYGKIDRFVNFNGAIWPLDYKTSSEVSARVFNNFDPNIQAVAYTLAGSHLVGERCPGLFLEFLRTSKTNAESVCHIVYIKDHWLEAFVKETKRMMDEILTFSDRREWPQRVSGCSPYGMFGGAGWVCDFKMLCDALHWTDALKFYNQREYEPLKVEEVKDEASELS